MNKKLLTILPIALFSVVLCGCGFYLLRGELSWPTINGMLCGVTIGSVFNYFFFPFSD